MTGILTLNDLMKKSENLTFLSFEEFLQQFRINTKYIKFHGLILAIKRHSRNLEFKSERLSHPFIPQILVIFLKNKKCVKDSTSIYHNSSDCANWHQQNGICS